jgi:hypothetical protein
VTIAASGAWAATSAAAAHPMSTRIRMSLVSSAGAVKETLN